MSKAAYSGDLYEITPEVFMEMARLTCHFRLVVICTSIDLGLEKNQDTQPSCPICCIALTVTRSIVASRNAVARINSAPDMKEHATRGISSSKTCQGVHKGCRDKGKQNRSYDSPTTTHMSQTYAGGSENELRSTDPGQYGVKVPT